MRLRSSSVALLALSLYAAPTLAADDVGTQPSKAAPRVEARAPASTATTPARPAAGTPEDIQRYSERQAASPDAKKYEGGDSTVVIGASTATIILAVVLLIVLL